MALTPERRAEMRAALAGTQTPTQTTLTPQRRAEMRAALGMSQPTEQRSFGEQVDGVAGQLGGGFNNVLGTLYHYAAPDRIVDRTINKVAGTDIPIRPPDRLERYLRSNEINNIQPQNFAERAAKRAGEELAIGLPAAGVSLAASALTKVPAVTQSLASAVRQSFTQGVANTPLRASIGEGTGTVLSATGAQAGAESSGDNPVAEFAGGIAASLAPGAATATISKLPTARVTRAVRNRLSPEKAKGAAKERVAKVIGGRLTPEREANLTEANRLKSEIEGFNPTLAESTNDPVLLRTQQAIEDNVSDEAFQSAVARRDNSMKAIDQFASNVAPGRDIPIEYIIDDATNSFKSVIDDLDSQISQTGGRVEGLASSLQRADRSLVGSKLRDSLKARRRATANRMKEIANEMGINSLDVSADYQNLKNSITDALGSKTFFSDTKQTPEVARLIKDFPDKRINFQQITDLRERLNDDILDSIGAANPSKRKVRELMIIKEKVDDFLNNLEGGEQYRQFIDIYRRELIEKFEKGAAFKVKSKNKVGDYQVTDEKVADAFFAPGNITAARQFKSIYNDSDQEAYSALEAAMFDSLRTYAGFSGEVIKPTQYQNWLKQHESVLNEFPQLRRKVRSIGDASTGLLQRQATLTQRRQQIENDILFKELKNASGEKANPEKFLQTLVNNPRLMRKTWDKLSSEAKIGLRRQVWDYANTLEPKDLLTFIEKNQKALQTPLGSKHIEHLKTIQAARAIMDRTPSPKGQASDNNPLKKLEDELGVGIPQIASRIFAIQSGRTSARFVATELAGRFFRGFSKNEMEALMTEALYDPAVAEDLVQFMTYKQYPKRIAKRLNGYLLQLGYNTAFNEEEQSRQQP